MRPIILSFCLLAVTASAFTANRLRASEGTILNRFIDYEQFLQDARVVASLRQSRRITEAEFIEMAKDPGTIILDARSAEKYRQLHIKGARNLSLPDITAAELAQVIPDKTARILIYCNNNFENEPVAFPTKAAPASLNIYTFNTLYSYGYQNVYELGPLLDINTTQLPLEGERSATRGQ
jgi:3-mercaptopyruvate sulfurtransferase SseA